MTTATQMPPIYASAKQLLADRQKWHPNADYRWIIGQWFMREILLSGSFTIQPVSDEVRRKLDTRPREWDRYPHFADGRPAEDFAQFCTLPALIIGSIEQNVAILLRDGIPCGAVHCEAME